VVHLAVSEAAIKRIRQDGERPKSWLDFVKVLDLMIEVALLAGRQLQRRGALNQNFEKEGEKVEVRFRRWNRERVDVEAGRIKADADIPAAEEPREALKAAAQVENEGVRVVLLHVCDEKVQEERFA